MRYLEALTALDSQMVGGDLHTDRTRFTIDDPKATVRIRVRNHLNTKLFLYYRGLR
jgi:hypothetical protein